MEPLQIEADAAEIANRAARIASQQLTQAVAQRGLALLGLSGGRTMPALLSELATLHADWQNIAIFMVDERCVALDSADSNWRMVVANLIEPLRRQGKMVEQRIYPFRYLPERIDMGIPIYRSQFADACRERTGGGARGFDVALLGVGEDAHVGSLFPGHPSIFSDMPDYLAVFGSPKPPSQRVSVSRRLLADSGALLLFFVGASKRAALQAFRRDSLTVEQCPARVAFEAAAAWVFTDQPEQSAAGPPRRRIAAQEH